MAAFTGGLLILSLGVFPLPRLRVFRQFQAGLDALVQAGERSLPLLHILADCIISPHGARANHGIYDGYC